MDPRIISINGYSIFFKVLGLEPHYQMKFSVIPRTFVGVGSDLSVEMQSAYSIDSANWVRFNFWYNAKKDKNETWCHITYWQEKDTNKLGKDSPTFMGENLRVLLIISAWKEWKVKRRNVCSSFLRGKAVI